MEKETVFFNKLHPDAIIPKRGTQLSAGFDLYAVKDTLIVGGAGNFLVPTGIAVQLPRETYGRIAMRSGLALNQHLTISAGVIDRDYTGPIGVLVSSTKLFELKQHDLQTEPNDTPKLEDSISSESGQIVTKENKYNSIELTTNIARNVSEIIQVVTPHTYLIKKGERFAQLVVERVCYAPGAEILLIENTGPEHIGFGSTGTE